MVAPSLGRPSSCGLSAAGLTTGSVGSVRSLCASFPLPITMSARSLFPSMGRSRRSVREVAPPSAAQPFRPSTCH